MEAVIFDVDGTLVDSVDLHAQAWKEAFAKFGKEVAVNAVRDQIGKGGDELMPVFLSKAEIEEYGDKLKKYRSKLFKAEYIDRVKPFAKVRKLMRRLKRNGKLLALGSSADKADLQVYLNLMDIADLIDVKTSADDAARSKPHPDIFETVLAGLNVPAEKVLVVGDSPYDAQAAGRANLKSIGLLSGGFEKQTLLNAGALALFDSPADLYSNYDSSPLAI